MTYRGLAWRSVAALGFSAFALVACGDDDAKDPVAEPDGGQEAGTDAGVDASGDASGPDSEADANDTKSVRIAFEARVGELPMNCSDTYPALSNAAIKDMRMYVYDVRLTAADGGEVPVELEQDGKYQYQDAALLDFEDGTGNCDTGSGTPELHQELTGTVPAGSYSGLSFRIGLPYELNHSDPVQSEPPLDIQHLSWNWTQGRILFNLDLVPEGAGGLPVHLGARGCTGMPAAGEEVTCAKPNMAHVQLPTFNPDTSKVIFDLAALLVGVDLNVSGGGHNVGCMSQEGSPTCEAVFANLGIDKDTGLPIEPGQAVFQSAAR